MRRSIKARWHQFDKSTWRCRWLHGFPPLEDAVFVWDIDSGRLAGFLCHCGSARWPTPDFAGERKRAPKGPSDLLDPEQARKAVERL